MKIKDIRAALTALVRGLEVDLLEALGVAELPPPLLPQAYVLS